MRKLLVALCLVSAGGTSSVAQDSGTQSNHAEGGSSQSRDVQKPSELDLDPDLNTLSQDRPDGSYSSKSVGAKQKWQMDKGYFDSDEQRTGVTRPDESSQDYSGIRLRRPRQP